MQPSSAGEMCQRCTAGAGAVTLDRVLIAMSVPFCAVCTRVVGPVLCDWVSFSGLSVWYYLKHRLINQVLSLPGNS